MNLTRQSLLELKDGKPKRLLVKLFEEAILKYQSSNMATVEKNDSYDKLIRNDLKFLKQACLLYSQGRMKQAERKIDYLDTNVREVVPCVCFAQIFGMDCLTKTGIRHRQAEIRKLLRPATKKQLRAAV